MDGCFPTALGRQSTFSNILPSEKRNIAPIAEREMPLQNWEEPEVQLEFPEQEAAARPPLIRSAEAEKLIQIGERERRDATVKMREEGKRRSSLDERIEKMKERNEGETSLALVLGGATDPKAEKGSEPLLDNKESIYSFIKSQVTDRTCLQSKYKLYEIQPTGPARRLATRCRNCSEYYRA